MTHRIYVEIEIEPEAWEQLKALARACEEPPPAPAIRPALKPALEPAPGTEATAACPSGSEWVAGCFVVGFLIAALVWPTFVFGSLVMLGIIWFLVKFRWAVLIALVIGLWQ